MSTNFASESVVSGKQRRFRKKSHHTPNDKMPLSASLRFISDLVSQRRYPEALSAADSLLLNPALTRHDQGRVLSLVADSEYKRGAYMESAELHLKAAKIGLDHHDLWLRPLIGHVMALLKIPDLTQARVMADHAFALASARMNKFDEYVRTASDTLRKSGCLDVPRLPPRPSVVATRLGYLFYAEGEIADAERFFDCALDLNPRGACRARQGKAMVAAARNQPGVAVVLAEESIRRGRFQAKTLSSWPTLIAARRSLGGWKIKDRLIRGLDAAPAGVRARAILIITRELRKHGMRQWQTIAKEWSEREGREFPVIDTEIKKMMLATSRVHPTTDDEVATAAHNLMRCPSLSFSEWLTCAKDIVREKLVRKERVDVDQLIAAALFAYGSERTAQVRHSLALSCMMGGRHDLARNLLYMNLELIPEGEPMWGKTIWALARMEALFNQAESARLYRLYAIQPNLPDPLRLQANLRWVTALIQSGQADSMENARSEISAILGKVEDLDVRMNIARQIYITTPELAGWARSEFDAAVAIAHDAFSACTQPDEAIDILFKLTRRQVCDFGRAGDAIEFWESLSSHKIDWLWTRRSRYWEYMGLLIEAYLIVNRHQDAQRIFLDINQDPATPPIGRVYVATPLALWLLHQHRRVEAFDLFDTIVSLEPSQAVANQAWYWLSLDALVKGDKDRATACATRILAANGDNAVAMADRAKMILSEWTAGFDANGGFVALDDEYQSRLRESITQDMVLLK